MKHISLEINSRTKPGVVHAHSCNSRHCNHVLSKELDRLATNLLQDMVRFQDKKFAEDPVKAKARRRYVVGLREATKYMKV